MALPNSRNTTYAPGVQVKSFDLNDIQDKIISLQTQVTAHAGFIAALQAQYDKHPTRGLYLPAKAGWVNSFTEFTADGVWWPNGAGQVIVWPLPLRSGDTLEKVSLYWSATNSASRSLVVQVYDLAAANLVAPAANWSQTFSGTQNFNSQPAEANGTDFVLSTAKPFAVATFTTGHANDQAAGLAMHFKRV